MDNAELARESLERAHETAEGHSSSDMTRVAVMISVLAAGLALSEMGEKASQNQYLTHHVALSDAYAYYQARTIRGNVLTEQRDHAFHLYHQYEMVVGALQIAIVLASVSVVTRIRSLTAGAGLIGAAAIVYGLLVATGTL